MKIRSDFVSNSSSSSFIFKEDYLLSNVRKDELFKALMQLFTHEEYEKEFFKHSSVELVYEPFSVYDVKDKIDRKNAFERYADLLDMFDARWPADERSGSPKKLYDAAIEAIEAGYEIVGLGRGAPQDVANAYIMPDGLKSEIYDALSNVINHIPLISSSAKRQMIGTFLEDAFKLDKSSVPREVKKVIAHMRDHFEIMTNKEVLEDKSSKYFVHFHENAIFQLKGFNDEENDKFGGTPANSIWRFMHLLYHQLAKMGKIDPAGYYDEKEFTFNSLLTYCLHEG